MELVDPEGRTKYVSDTLFLVHLIRAVRTCFADLHSQFGQLSLEDGLLLLWQAFLLVWFLVRVERLHLHIGSILVFPCRRHSETFSC